MPNVSALGRSLIESHYNAEYIKFEKGNCYLCDRYMPVYIYETDSPKVPPTIKICASCQNSMGGFEAICIWDEG